MHILVLFLTCRFGCPPPNTTGFREHKVQALASGEIAAELMAKTVAGLRNELSWQQIPHTEENASLLFSVHLRVAATSVHDLVVPFSAWPYRLVELIYPSQADVFAHSDWEERVAIFLSAPACQMDRFSRAFRDSYNTAEALHSKLCQELLKALCRELDGSTYSTERLHASTSRRVRARISTHQMSLAQAAAFHSQGIPHSCLRFASLLPSNSPKQQKRLIDDADATDKRSKRQKCAGGSWRAFLHCQAQGPGRKNLHDLAMQYGALEA